MTLRVWPAAVPLDPDARVLPAPLAATLAGAGAVAPVILLVAGADAVASGWAPNAAVALAEAWSRDGLRLVLADLSIGAPALDGIVGEPNDEGLADVFLFGASLKRVVRGAPTRGFGFIPAGSAPADSREVLTDAGWRQVVTHFFRDGAVLLAYVPSDAPGLDSLATRLGAVIALAAPSDLQPLDTLLPSDAAVLALIEPPAATPSGGKAAVPAEATLVRPEPLPEPTTRPLPEPLPEHAPLAVPEPLPEHAPLAVPEPLPDHAPLAAPEPLPEPATPALPEPLPRPATPALPEPVTLAGPEPAPEPVTRAGPEPTPEPVTLAGPGPTLEPEAAPRPRKRPPALESVSAESAPAAPVGAEEPLSALAESTAPSLAAPDPRRKPTADPHEALVDALWARRQGAQGLRPRGGAPAVDPVPGRRVSDEELLMEPPALAQEPRGRRLGLGLILWLILGAAVALGAVFGVEQYLTGQLPMVDRWLGRGSEPVARKSAARSKAPAAALAPRGAADQDAPGALPDSLPYSVAIEAHPQYAVAVERAAQLSKDEPDLGFFVTPMLRAGSIYYYVMGGPLPDSTSAAALVNRLLKAGVKTGTTPWDIFQTRLAFTLGDYASRGDAERQGALLAQKSIPTYVVEVTLPGGPPRWRLYAGAFPGAADANVLRPVLKGAGVPDSLVQRIGRTTQ